MGVWRFRTLGAALKAKKGRPCSGGVLAAGDLDPIPPA
jgi:hypothetical protein